MNCSASFCMVDRLTKEEKIGRQYLFTNSLSRSLFITTRPSSPTQQQASASFIFILFFSEGNYWPRAFSASHSPISQRNQSIWTTICRRATKGFSSSLSFFPVYCLIYKMPTKPKDIYMLCI